jgi:hypothetical protein
MNDGLGTGPGGICPAEGGQTLAAGSLIIVWRDRVGGRGRGMEILVEEQHRPVLCRNFIIGPHPITSITRRKRGRGEWRRVREERERQSSTK